MSLSRDRKIWQLAKLVATKRSRKGKPSYRAIFWAKSQITKLIEDLFIDANEIDLTNFAKLIRRNKR